MPSAVLVTAALLLIVASLTRAAAAQTLAAITVELASSAKPDPYVVSTRQTYTLALQRSDASVRAGTALRYRWTGPRGEPLGGAHEWPADAASVHLWPNPDVVLPAAGFAAVEVEAADPTVSLNGLPAGYPVRLGIVTVAAANNGTARLEHDSPFAMVHPPVDDPHLGPWVKRLSWSQAPRQFARELKRSRENDLINVPLLHGKTWQAPSGDKEPFTDTHARALRTKLAGVLEAVTAAGLSLPTRWQAGLESNGGNLLARPLYHANYAAKLAIVRHELESRAPGQRFELVASFRGFDFDEYRALRDGAAWPHIDAMSANLYRWRDFPMPDGWLPGVLDTLRQIVGDKPLIIGEMGNPVRGQPDAAAFYGYPAKRDAIPGATRHRVANYMVRSHVLALASNTVERLYWYNYRNRGARLDYAEHHFGLRAFRASGNPSHGHPLPAYASYVTMVRQLSGRRYASTVTLAPGVQGYRFDGRSAGGAGGAVVVAWAPDKQGPVDIPLAVLPGVTGVTDLFGTALYPRSHGDAALNADETLRLGMEPVFIELLG